MAGFRSESWPASNRNPWPTSFGIINEVDRVLEHFRTRVVGCESLLSDALGVLVLAFIVYGFLPDSYEVTFRIETPQSNVLVQSGGYELVWRSAAGGGVPAGRRSHPRVPRACPPR